MSGAMMMVGQERYGMTYFSQVLDEITAGPDRNGVWHAVEAMSALQWARQRSRRRTWDAACGVRVPVTWVRVQTADGDEARRNLPWPPRVSSIPAGQVRCRECHEVTGRKRPLLTFVDEEVAS